MTAELIKEKIKEVYGEEHHFLVLNGGNAKERIQVQNRVGIIKDFPLVSLVYIKKKTQNVLNHLKCKISFSTRTATRKINKKRSSTIDGFLEKEKSITHIPRKNCTTTEKVLDKFVRFTLFKEQLAFNTIEETKVICDMMGNEAFKEIVPCFLIGAEHNLHKNYFDGKLGNIFIELKSETIGGESKRISKLNGNATFNNVSDTNIIKFRIYSNDLFIVNGFDGSVLEYSVAFKIKDILPYVEKWHSNPKKSRTFRVNHTMFPEEFEVIYLNKIIDRDKYTIQFLQKLLKNYTSGYRLYKKPLVKPEYAN